MAGTLPVTEKEAPVSVPMPSIPPAPSMAAPPPPVIPASPVMLPTSPPPMPASVPVASVPPSTAALPEVCAAADPAVSVPASDVAPVCAPLAEPPAEVVVSPAVVPASVCVLSVADVALLVFPGCTTITLPFASTFASGSGSAVAALPAVAVSTPFNINKFSLNVITSISFIIALHLHALLHLSFSSCTSLLQHFLLPMHLR